MGEINCTLSDIVH